MTNLTPTGRASRWLAQFGSAIAASDVRGAAAQFRAESYWRDLVSFTWNVKTMEGAGEIGTMLGVTAEQIRPSAWSLVGGRQKSTATSRPGSNSRPRYRAASATCGSRASAA